MTISEGIKLSSTEAQIILAWALVKASDETVLNFLNADKVLFLKDGRALAYKKQDIFLFSSSQITALLNISVTD